MMMKKISLLRVSFVALVLLAAAAVTGAVLATGASGDSSRHKDERGGLPERPGEAGFTTLFRSPLGIEGLTGDRRGNLYSAGRGGDNPCPVWRLPAAGGQAAVVGTIPPPCGPAGLTFDASGRLFVADSADGQVYVLTPRAENPPTAILFASGVPGANGLAFDSQGNLWVSDGTTGQGRVWKVDDEGTPSEAFRVQPMVNEVNLVNGVGGVGRDPRSLPPGAVTITPTGRSAANTAGSQHLVANGLAFTKDGTLFVADTARGAIWKVELGRGGTVRSPVGCDTTFTANTLCLDNVFVAHPLLEGADGIALDRAGSIWVAANERNAIVVVTQHGRVVEFFRNAPDPQTRLRNEGPMEFPTSPFLTGRRLCITHSDGSRRDNFPSTGGEVRPDASEVAKISCLEKPLAVPGLPLPAR
jgi:sugar lactone lactonase YvrE